LRDARLGAKKCEQEKDSGVRRLRIPNFGPHPEAGSKGLAGRHAVLLYSGCDPMDEGMAAQSRQKQSLYRGYRAMTATSGGWWDVHLLC
jgi:hypothetical protein